MSFWAGICTQLGWVKGALSRRSFVLFLQNAATIHKKKPVFQTVWGQNIEDNFFPGLTKTRTWRTIFFGTEENCAFDPERLFLISLLHITTLSRKAKQ